MNLKIYDGACNLRFRNILLDFAGIDGPEDMKLIYGIIAVERKDKQGKEGKVTRRTNRISISF